MNAWFTWLLTAIALFVVVWVLSTVLDLFGSTKIERRYRLRDETVEFRRAQRALRRGGKARWYPLDEDLDDDEAGR